MKKLIKQIASIFGYAISRAELKRAADPYVAMRALLSGVERPIIFDVGACYGEFSLRLKQIFPQSTVYAFEPFDVSFRRLKRSANGDCSIHIFDYGLSDSCGIKKFYSNAVAQTNSLLPTDSAAHITWWAGALETREVIDAKFDTLDNVLARYEIPRIDLLKLDVQGAEQLVMAGSLEACRRQSIAVIYTEVILQPTYESQIRFDEQLKCFYDLGFDLYSLYNLSFADNGKLRQVDAIFTRRGAPLARG